MVVEGEKVSLDDVGAQGKERGPPPGDLVEIPGYMSMPKRFLKGVTPTRNAELMHYQEELRQTRLAYKKEFANKLTGSELRGRQKEDKARLRLDKWQDYMKQLKADLDDPNSELNKDVPDRHRKEKNEVERAHGVTNLHHALLPHQKARRVYVALLNEQLTRPTGAICKSSPSDSTFGGFSPDSFTIIQKQDLDAIINRAVANPTNFNLNADAMVASELFIRKRCNSLRVPVDPIVYQVPPGPKDH